MYTLFDLLNYSSILLKQHKGQSAYGCFRTFSSHTCSITNQNSLPLLATSKTTKQNKQKQICDKLSICYCQHSKQ